MTRIYQIDGTAALRPIDTQRRTFDQVRCTKLAPVAHTRREHIPTHAFDPELTVEQALDNPAGLPMFTSAQDRIQASLTCGLGVAFFFIISFITVI